MGFLSTLSNGAGSLLGGAVSGASGLLGSLLSIGQQNKMLKAQQHENQLNRDFNSAEAQKLRDFQVQMFNMTNDYNDPSKVVQRLQSAGLNPALAFGGFQNATFGGSSAQASSSGSISPTPADMSGISNMGFAATQGALAVESTKADIELKKSQAAKNMKETSWIDRLSAVKERLDNQNINIGIKVENLTEIQAQEVCKQMELFEQQITNLKQQNANDEIQFRILTKEEAWYDIEKNQGIQESISRMQSYFENANLSKQQAYNAAMVISHEIALLDANTKASNTQASLNHTNRVSQYLENKIKTYLVNHHYKGIAEAQWKSIINGLAIQEGEVDLQNVRKVTESVMTALEVFDRASAVYTNSKGPKKIGYTY